MIEVRDREHLQVKLPNTTRTEGASFHLTNNLSLKFVLMVLNLNTVNTYSVWK